MLEIVTPLTLFHTQLHALRTALPSVLEGQPTGIHDARIATRRIREVLPLIGPQPRWASEDELRLRFKRMGRSLGRVRDADVRLALIAYLEDRVPHAEPALVLLRQQRERERLTLIRKLIKRLERLEALRLVDALAGHRPSRLTRLEMAARGTKWRRELRSVIVTRAQEAEAAIAHATGVYFPNRAHTARIAIKRLRYAVEIAHNTGSADCGDAIRELKKAQDLLGDLHDRQELSDHLALEAAGPLSTLSTPVNGGDQVALIRQVIDAETRRLHERYLQRRDRLMAVCHDCLPVSRLPGKASASALAIALVALSSGVYFARSRRRVEALPS